MTILSEELVNDPLGRNYSGMNSVAAAADIMTEYRTGDVASLSGDEVFAATDNTEFAALTDLQKQLWLSFCGRETIDPHGTANVEFLQWVFGGTSDTQTALVALRTKPISRSVELTLGVTSPGDIEYARAA